MPDGATCDETSPLLGGTSAVARCGGVVLCFFGGAQPRNSKSNCRPRAHLLAKSSLRKTSTCDAVFPYLPSSLASCGRLTRRRQLEHALRELALHAARRAAG